MYRVIGRFMAALSALVGVGYLFGMAGQLGANRGRGGNFGEMFMGLAGLFGEIPARIIVGSAFLLLGWLFWRAQRPKSKPQNGESN